MIATIFSVIFASLSMGLAMRVGGAPVIDCVLAGVGLWTLLMLMAGCLGCFDEKERRPA